MEALSRREENEVMAAAKANSLKQCDDLVSGMPLFGPRPLLPTHTDSAFFPDFADCATGRTFTLPFVCRGPLKLMQDCQRSHMTTEKLDAMKLDYIANRSEKGRLAVETLRAGRIDKLRGKTQQAVEKERI
ncbi:hypothetical protein P7C73_g5420, partial [Tremellales sp. Uapishka_1]